MCFLFLCALFWTNAAAAAAVGMAVWFNLTVNQLLFLRLFSSICFVLNRGQKNPKTSEAWYNFLICTRWKHWQSMKQWSQIVQSPILHFIFSSFPQKQPTWANLFSIPSTQDGTQTDFRTSENGNCCCRATSCDGATSLDPTRLVCGSDCPPCPLSEKRPCLAAFVSLSFISSSLPAKYFYFFSCPSSATFTSGSDFLGPPQGGRTSELFCSMEVAFSAAQLQQRVFMAFCQQAEKNPAGWVIHHRCFLFICLFFSFRFPAH